MEFKDKYISAAEKAIDTKSKKTVLSDDAFAIVEYLDILIKTIANK